MSQVENEAPEGATPINAHLWARHPEDYYIEPAWTSSRLFQAERFDGTILDPACGSGRIVRSAEEAGLIARGSDIVDRPRITEAPFYRSDFRGIQDVDNVVSNPPFGVADEFARRMLRIARRKVALLLPAQWVAGDERGRWLGTTPLLRVYQITPRPSMPPGPVIEAGIAPGGGKKDFVWLVWLRGYDGPPEFRWLRRDPA